MENFASYFQDLEDPRHGNAGQHELLEILMIALCTTLCGGKSAVDMELFGQSKEALLRQFLTLEHGIPSHDTFSRVLRLLDPDQFRACFQTFMAGFAETCGLEHKGVVAIDGKVLRGSFDKASGQSALHMVSAWGNEQGLVLAQIAVDEKSNEITAVPKLLELLCLEGTIVTVDALNTQREIARKIVDKGGDYALALKKNQATLYRDVVDFFEDPEVQGLDIDKETDGGHGRIETREHFVSSDIDWLQQDHHWPGLKAIGKVVRSRETRDKCTAETAYYLLASALPAESFGRAVRGHWGIENRLHWVLDVTMGEDLCRTRKDNAPHNLAVLRHMALNIINKEPSKRSRRGKFIRAGWDDSFLFKLLAEI